MEIYTEVAITPHHAGFGVWEAGEHQPSPQHSYADEQDLLDEIRQNCYTVLPIAEALGDAEYTALGIEDIRGKINGPHGDIYACIRLNPRALEYFALVKSEVADDYYR